jgi:hypothetical protein
MKSLYAEYLEEKTNDQIIETDEGFITYRIIADSIYIIDIYIKPEFRNKHNATKLAQMVIDKYVTKVNEQRAITKLIGSVIPSSKNSTESMKVLLAYGMTLKNASQDFIVFEKDLRNL